VYMYKPRVLQWIVSLAAVRRAAHYRGRCGKAGAVEIQAPYSGARRGYRISQDRPKPRRASGFCCGVGPRGTDLPPNACFEGTSINACFAASRLPIPTPRCGNTETLPICELWMNFAGYRSECCALCLRLSV
jgi:hypothetical protein